MQFKSGCSPPSWRNAPAEIRRLHLLSINRVGYSHRRRQLRIEIDLQLRRR